MPILNFGERLNSTYLEKFLPPENTPKIISILALKSIAVEYHWLDIPTIGVKGSFACNGGVCCQYFGTRNQTYHVPVFVYTNSENTEGTVMDWNLTKTLYETLCDYATRYDLTKYDLEVVRTRQNQMNTRTTFTVVPSPCRRDYMTPEQKQSIEEAVEFFFATGESTIVQQLSDEKYLEYARYAAIPAPQAQKQVPFNGMIQPPKSATPQFGKAPVKPAIAPPPQAPSFPGFKHPAGSMQTPVQESPKSMATPVGDMRVASKPANSPSPNVGFVPQTPPQNTVSSGAKELTPDEIDNLLGEVQGV